jgi:G3E family GTPase
MNEKIPVTVLTGFLGSGKTTLLNRILSEDHGLRIAVIENEFGEIGVDQDLVINADEEILEMNNGCICCTVRGDLIRILTDLMTRSKKFDRVIIETTGLADPGPVAQTFFIDEAMRDAFYLDGIITLVDSKHIMRQLDSSEEAESQIAFADLIVLNKIDVVDEGELAIIESRVKRINGLAHVYKATMANAPIAKILDVGGFDLNRALETNPSFLEPEYAFEWGGIFNLQESDYDFMLDSGPDETLSLAWVPMADATEESLKKAAESVFIYFSHPPKDVAHQGSLSTALEHWQLQLTGEAQYKFHIHNPTPGLYALFTQHGPEEFNAELLKKNSTQLTPLIEHRFNAEHHHDDTVTSVSIEIDEPLDGDRLEKVLDLILRTQAENIYRMKGILSIEGEDHRYIYQAVHMLFDGQWGTVWGDKPRTSRMVFIGKNLVYEELLHLFNFCRYSFQPERSVRENT